MPGLELLPWKMDPPAIQKEINERLKATGMSRQVVPQGPDSIEQEVVVVPTLQAGPPISYGPNRLVSPVHIYVDTTFTDQDAADPARIQRAIGSAAAQLGVIEDQEVILGGAPPVPAVPPFMGRFARYAALSRDGLTGGAGLGFRPPIPIGAAAGAAPVNGNLLKNAIIQALAALAVAGRPGPLALLVSDPVMTTLRLPRPRAPGVPSGTVPLIQEIESLIGDQIVRTSALAGVPIAAGDICGVLLRLEPAAADVVYTQLPTVTFVDRAAGLTRLRVEEEIAVRLLDPAAIQTIAY